MSWVFFELAVENVCEVVDGVGLACGAHCSFDFDPAFRSELAGVFRQCKSGNHSEIVAVGHADHGQVLVFAERYFARDPPNGGSDLGLNEFGKAGVGVISA
jgi:hypothetical protein